MLARPCAWASDKLLSQENGCVQQATATVIGLSMACLFLNMWHGGKRQ